MVEGQGGNQGTLPLATTLSLVTLQSTKEASPGGPQEVEGGL